MGRHRHYVPLKVYLNNRLVGHLFKEPSGAIKFRYDGTWLGWDQAFSVSLSMPLREDDYQGATVAAIFENLLPDSEALRRRVAEKVGARGTDVYSLLSAIGRDCIGALQFVPEDSHPHSDTTVIEGEPVGEQEIEMLLGSLAQAPLGLSRDDDFRISIAGEQEKTALLWHGGRWLKPRGTTPTSHIFKTQIGQLPNGIDFSDSVENEFYCLKLFEAFGLSVNRAEIQTFGNTTALVIERFDRHWTKDGRLLRLPQEDCCQALSIPPTQKYQSDHGPGMVDVLNLLKGSDRPADDQTIFIKAQILFWLIGATDGHAKNFSLFLGPGGRHSLTPLYDILTALPSLDTRQIERKQMKLAMAVGNNRHYRMDQIQARHFVQTGAKAGLPRTLIHKAIEEIADTAENTLSKVEKNLPAAFPEKIHASVKAGMTARLHRLALPNEG
ncbi:type II toxin-antitoxin system HipA family toxin [Verrucomicrobia bacterium]|jgi:serine/threonine-protein kinase HipA|nr:type II toxin-antitoxin system HipA family toxin [Verrucomicrobiota bacterium]MDA7510290.1 type II toxin-antitoxin system HipA family toxin [Verrucomicrobiota bacterium]MDA7657920.1 type II toxin-antitoxin system HipA family toxin [Verrucomicrobiota bacterium]